VESGPEGVGSAVRGAGAVAGPYWVLFCHERAGLSARWGRGHLEGVGLALEGAESAAEGRSQ